MNQIFNKYRISWGIGMVFAVMATILPTWWQNEKMKVQILQLEKDIDGLRRQVKHHQQETTSLQQDSNYVEYLLRKELHYGRKGEHIWKLPRQTSEK